MKTLIKFALIISVLTLLFIKVYVPLMYEKETGRAIDIANQNLSLNEKITSDRMELYQNSILKF